MPSETSRPSSRESPPACGPIASADAAPGSRFQDRTNAPRRDSGLPPGQRHAEKCRAKNHAANGQGVAKRDPGDCTRAATNRMERDQRPLPARCTSSQVRSTGFGSAITLCGRVSQRRRHRAGREQTPPFRAHRWA
jgi:hypothetical protein